MGIVQKIGTLFVEAAIALNLAIPAQAQDEPQDPAAACLFGKHLPEKDKNGTGLAGHLWNAFKWDVNTRGGVHGETSENGGDGKIVATGQINPADTDQYRLDKIIVTTFKEQKKKDGKGTEKVKELFSFTPGTLEKNVENAPARIKDLARDPAEWKPEAESIAVALSSSLSIDVGAAQDACPANSAPPPPPRFSAPSGAPPPPIAIAGNFLNPFQWEVDSVGGLHGSARSNDGNLRATANGEINPDNTIALNKITVTTREAGGTKSFSFIPHGAEGDLKTAPAAISAMTSQQRGGLENALTAAAEASATASIVAAQNAPAPNQPQNNLAPPAGAVAAQASGDSNSSLRTPYNGPGLPAGTQYSYTYATAGEPGIVQFLQPNGEFVTVPVSPNEIRDAIAHGGPPRNADPVKAAAIGIAAEKQSSSVAPGAGIVWGESDNITRGLGLEKVTVEVPGGPWKVSIDKLNPNTYTAFDVQNGAVVTSRDGTDALLSWPNGTTVSWRAHDVKLPADREMMGGLLAMEQAIQIADRDAKYVPGKMKFSPYGRKNFEKLAKADHP